MGAYRRERRLLVALLVVGVSSGLGARTAGPAGAIALAMGAAPAARPWLPLARASEGAFVPPGLANTPAVSATWSQQAELTSTAQSGSDCFACAVALGGNTVVVGAGGTPYPNSYGAAYIFGRTGSTWTQQAEFTDPASGYNDYFGNAVAVDGRGATVVIGAQGESVAAPYSGAVFVYTRSGSTWTQQAEITATDAAYNDEFGNAVALSGTTLAVGAFNKNVGLGAVYIFVRSGSTWTQQAELLYPGPTNHAGFGEAVALSGDTLVVTTFSTRVAYVYVRSGTTWTLQAQLPAPPQANGQYFGFSAAVSGDTVLVNACCATFRVPATVAVFGRSGTTWTQQAIITPPNGASAEEFGFRVGLSGHTAVIGGGPTYIYVGHGSTWREQAELMPTDESPRNPGIAVAVQGNTVVAGDTDWAAYVFLRKSPPGASQAASLGASVTV